MEDKEITTLHPYLNRNKNRYPNVKDENIPESIQRKLIPGDGISIDGNNVISATAKEVDAYTKDESDAKYATKTEYDDLSKATPTDIGIKDNKLGLLHDSLWLTNQGAINLENFDYDEATNTLKPNGGGEGSSVGVIELTDEQLNTIYDNYTITFTSAQETVVKKDDVGSILITHQGISLFKMSLTTLYSDPTSSPIYSLTAFVNNDGLTDIVAISISDFTTPTKVSFASIPTKYLSNVGIGLNNEPSNCLVFSVTNDDYFVPIYTDTINDTPIIHYKNDETINHTIIDNKSISLFGNHSILVPSDSSDNNIDLYNHNIVITSADKKSVIYLTITSSSNLVVDSITDLNTLLKTQSRNIMVTGIRTLDGASLPIISIDWNGAFVGSNYTWVDPINEEDNESLTTAFGSATITDVVTTI